MKVKTFYGVQGKYLTVTTFLNWANRGIRHSFGLHYFHRGDEDPDCHDHPFHFWSFVLWGGYREYDTMGHYLIRKPLSLVYRKATTRHRVQLLGRCCITLVWKIDARRDWGFWKNGIFIPWRQYIDAKGLEPTVLP